MTAAQATSTKPDAPLLSPTRKPASRAERSGLSTASDSITVFAVTCQHVPWEQDSLQVSTVFKPFKFKAVMRRTATLEDLQCFLMSQWVIAKSPFAEIPVDEQFYMFKGRILRLDGSFDAYYIEDNDAIYLRFSSLGKVCDPWAMSTSELRSELKARQAYVPKLQPEQLMMRLQEQVMRESRLQRLQRATKQEEEDQVQSITKEIAVLNDKLGKAVGRRLDVRAASQENQFARPASLQWPHSPSKSRTVFLSISLLEKTYQAIPRDVLDPAIFIFDADRKWVFDKHNVLQKQQFDYRYMCFEDDFLELLTLKEELGLVFWFRPAKNYEKLSSFLTAIDDPVTERKLNPLILKETKWLTLCGVNGWEGKVRQDGRRRDTSKVPKFTKSVMRITTNLQSQSFDYLAVQELLYQSNPTLLFAPL
ncbi:hypothetical protein P43SY_001009 [Pythium insidiosum]|uniref:Ubiquitin-like domain-containing protein n=1 Tax=Pythium insidiosum TaxID=114742 RepID=A0AAD5M1Y4_PYTIN|nr:hypothetical protein P43SY_001009 [Pythium insidiosum]